MTEDEFNQLLKYLDGNLSPQELHETESLLASNARARETLREIALQAIAIRDQARFQSSCEQLAVEEVAPRRAFPKMPVRAFAMGIPVALALLFIGYFAWFWHGDEHALRVLRINGAMTWKSKNGKVLTEFPDQTLLGEGEIVLVGQGAKAELAYEDGTRIVLGDDAQVDVSSNRERKIVLRSGRVDADVVPQIGNPFVVETPVAKLSVVGTVFSVRADSQQTSMNVESGLVELQRKSDRKIVQVAAKHGSSVSVDSSAPLRVTPYLIPPTKWKADATRRTLMDSYGERAYDPATGTEMLKAVVLVASRKRGQAPVLHYGVHFQELTSEGNLCFVRLSEKSRMRITYRLKKPSPILIFAHAQINSTTPGENFELLVPESELDFRPMEWMTIELPFDGYRAIPPIYGNKLTELWISALSVKTFDRDSELEVREVEILEKPTDVSLQSETAAAIALVNWKPSSDRCE